MGTVGLSFGSPTSGAGFNVSSTVSAIMANLSGVETPWNNQLTTINSQDTVLSSLGTLLSNLSTDMTNLTDATGVLSQKEGSSSNTGVLELTAASNSAVAGTHTVVVSALASTSSGFLTEVTNSSDTLAGSVVIQVGTAAAQTVSLTSSDNTLSGLASAINAAGIGVSASVLTDASGSRLSIVSGTSGANGDLTITSAITDSSNTTATAMSYTGITDSTKTLDSATFGSVASASDVLSGSMTLKVSTGAAQNIAMSATETLTGLASAINSDNLGVTANVVTNSDGTYSIALLSQTAGSTLTMPNFNLTDTTPTTPTTLSYAETGAVGTLGTVANKYDTLTGSVVLQVGTGTAKTITLNSSDSTISGLASAINTANLGVTASVLTNATTGVSSIALVPQTPGAAVTVTPSLKDNVPVNLGYTNAVTGSNGSLTVDGVNLVTSSNTVTNLIPGITFQLLATSTDAVQVVIANYNTGVESSVNSLVTDYNSLISAMNVQEGLDSAGNNEPLYGSPTLSMLQQDILNGINATNPNGYVDAVSNTAGTTLSGSVSVGVGGGTVTRFVLGAPPSSGVAANTVYTGSGKTSLSDLASAINAANYKALSYTGTAGTSSAASTGTLTSIDNSADTLSGSMSIQVGTGTAKTFAIGAEPSTGAITGAIYTGSGINTLSGLASAINTANIGVTASVVTNSDGTSSLSLLSATSGTTGTLTVNSGIAASGLGVTAAITTVNDDSTLTLTSSLAGSSGTLAVTSALTATSPTPLTFAAQQFSSTTASAGVLGSSISSSDTLTGSIIVQVGSTTTQTITLGSGDNTLTELAATINADSLGVTAVAGTTGLTLTANTVGLPGELTITPYILDPTTTTSTKLNYNASSDINSLSGLGISINNDGTMSLDSTSLDSVLNADYSGVQAMFQNANSWGTSFATTLTNAGTTSSTGIISLTEASNSSIESTLNADISRENMLISSESKSLTAQLNSANEIMQELPTQLSGVNELYSAITGYNQSQN